MRFVRQMKHATLIVNLRMERQIFIIAILEITQVQSMHNQRRIGLQVSNRPDLRSQAAQNLHSAVVQHQEYQPASQTNISSSTSIAQVRFAQNPQVRAIQNPPPVRFNYGHLSQTAQGYKLFPANRIELPPIAPQNQKQVEVDKPAAQQRAHQFLPKKENLSADNSETTKEILSAIANSHKILVQQLQTQHQQQLQTQHQQQKQTQHQLQMLTAVVTQMKQQQRTQHLQLQQMQKKQLQFLSQISDRIRNTS